MSTPQQREDVEVEAMLSAPLFHVLRDEGWDVTRRPS